MCHVLSFLEGQLLASATLLQCQQQCTSNDVLVPPRLHVISELKNLVEQKERFLSSMTHELRTPLNGIIGLSDAMLVGSCGKLNDTANKTITTIKNSGLRLLNLINDILDAAAMHKVRASPLLIADVQLMSGMMGGRWGGLTRAGSRSSIL
jgi:signal transduction histidine kinase